MWGLEKKKRVCWKRERRRWRGKEKESASGSEGAGGHCRITHYVSEKSPRKMQHNQLRLSGPVKYLGPSIYPSVRSSCLSVSCISFAVTPVGTFSLLMALKGQ